MALDELWGASGGWDGRDGEEIDALLARSIGSGRWYWRGVLVVATNGRCVRYIVHSERFEGVKGVLDSQFRAISVTTVPSVTR